jgi:hypothetical protein
MSEMPILTRADLARVFNNDPVLVAAFEQQQETVQATAEATGAQVEATGAIQAATVLVLSANDVFENERIFTPDGGIEIEDDDGLLRVRVDDTVPRIDGGFSATFIVTGTTAVIFPVNGTLATTSGTETFSNKTLATPKLSGLGDYADDSAAAAGGVPVGGVYRNGSVVRVRVS